MSSPRLLLPVAVGLSILTVTVSAFVVYYLLKNDEDEETTTARGAIMSSDIKNIEIKLPKSILPAFIGRGGSNIKEMERKSGALINCRKFTDNEHSVCTISGRSQAAEAAEMLVREFINGQPVLVEETMMAPTWAIAKIIGAQGVKIKEICHRSGARVTVAGSIADKASERLITFYGTKEQIVVARDLVHTIISQEKCHREVEQATNPRAPRSHSPSPAPAPASETEPAGPCIEVYVSAVSSPSRFWVQFVGPQVAQLDELVEHMTEYYSSKENRENHAIENVQVGQVVAAVFRHDGKWYRARVHDVRPNEFDPTQVVADLFFLDYGDSEYVATHELCELRADLLRLRFQAMECFLAGVRPVETENEENHNKWPVTAVDRFEDLVQVARWKPLVSRTCTYKKTSSAEGDKEKEIPGIKLYDATDEGELDIGKVLISEGHAIEDTRSPTEHAAPAATSQPFGDLGNSRVLGMLSAGGARAASLPKDHKDDKTDHKNSNKDEFTKETDKKAESKSLASGLDNSDRILSISNYDIALDSKPHVNGSNFLDTERLHMDTQNASSETLTPETTSKPEGLTKIQREECKANINRIDSHHGNLEALGRMHEF